MTKDRVINDVVIIGGGPAGMSAVMWCADLGLKVLIVEASTHFGGQLNWMHNYVKNYLGSDFKNGAEVRSAFERSIADLQYDSVFSRKAVDIDVTGSSVLLDGGLRVEAKAIVIATGVRRKELGVPGEKELLGKGILESGTRQQNEVKGRQVAVIGGGDAALENALILAESAERVYLVHRRESFVGRDEFLERIERHPKIEMLKNSVVESFEGKDHLKSIHLRKDGRIEELTIKYAIVRIGVEPNSEMVNATVETDDQGYIIVDPQCRTSAAGIWAIGDVANPVSPTIATAAGTGATCAKSIEKFVRENE